MILNIIIFVINELISPLIEVYIIVKLFKTFNLEKRLKHKYAVVVLYIEYTVGMNLVGHSLESKGLIELILIQVFIFLLLKLNFEGSIFKLIVHQGIFVFILILGEAVGAIILMSITDLEISAFYTSSFYYACAVITTKALQLLFLRIIVYKKVKQEITIENSFRIQVIALMVATLLFNIVIVSILFQTVNNNNLNILIALSAYLSSMIITILVAYIFFKIIKETKRQAEQQQIIEQYKLEHKYTQELNLLLDNLRILKHDLKNHISCMWGLIETDNIEDFKLYLANLTEEIEEINENEITRNINI